MKEPEPAANVNIETALAAHGRDGSTNNNNNNNPSNSPRKSPQFPEKKRSSSKDSVPSEDYSRLECQIWYHGGLPRQEISELLREEGDFLVRLTKVAGDEQLQVILSVRSGCSNKHIKIRKTSDGKWHVRDQGFDSVPDLINAYQRTKESVSESEPPAPLIRPILRPDWYLRNTSIKYEGTKKIGSGVFGDVFKVSVRLFRNQKYETHAAVIKKPKKSQTDEEGKSLVNEAKLLIGCKHPNVVRCFGIAADKFPVVICLEFCLHGELLSFLKSEKGSIKPVVKMKWNTQIAGGMTYLEIKRLIHRDLAARNCLLGNGLQIKISDFGMAKRGDQYKAEPSELKTVPIRCSAPETLKSGISTSKSDVFSFGVLLWEIYTEGDKPFGEDSPTMVVDKVMNGHRVLFPMLALQNGVSALADKAMNYRPADRPNFTELFAAFKSLLQTEFSLMYYNLSDGPGSDE